MLGRNMQQLPSSGRIIAIGLCLVFVGNQLASRVDCLRSWPSRPDDENIEHSRGDISWGRMDDDSEWKPKARPGARTMEHRFRKLSLSRNRASRGGRKDRGKNRINYDNDDGDTAVNYAQDRQDVTNGTKSDCRGASCSFQSKCGKAPLNKIAGRRSSSLSSGVLYIVNGEPQVYGEWPSFAHVSLHWWDSDGYNHCGGVVLTDQHVLTSAHCLFEYESRAMADLAEVYLGEHSTQKRDAQEKRFVVKSICVAKKYNRYGPLETLHNYAVLTLKDKIVFNDYHQPACLPYEQMDTTNATCYLIGAGATGFTANYDPKFPKTIEKMRVRKVSCAPWNINEKDTTRECYTKANGDGNACQGDHGGPVLCLDPKTKNWTVVATFSYGSSKCKETKYAWSSVYTRLAGLLPDIKANCGI